MIQDPGLFLLFSFTLQTGNLSGDASCAGKKKKKARWPGTDRGVGRKRGGVCVQKFVPIWVWGSSSQTDSPSPCRVEKQQGKIRAARGTLDLDGLLNALIACSRV